MKQIKTKQTKTFLDSISHGHWRCTESTVPLARLPARQVDSGDEILFSVDFF